jgi:hypothetical protein
MSNQPKRIKNWNNSFGANALPQVGPKQRAFIDNMISSSDKQVHNVGSFRIARPADGDEGCFGLSWVTNIIADEGADKSRYNQIKNAPHRT